MAIKHGPQQAYKGYNAKYCEFFFTPYVASYGRYSKRKGDYLSKKKVRIKTIIIESKSSNIMNLTD